MNNIKINEKGSVYMSDSYSTSSHESWFTRIKNAIVGVLIGIIMFIASFPVLFWNEGRAVRTAQSFAEGSKSVISVNADKVDSSNEKKLIHLTGLAATKETLTDSIFKVSEKNAIKLIRHVEMYQWKEHKKSETRKQTGGSKKTVTTYTYDKAWSDDLINSSNFNQSQGHQNPSLMPYSGEEKHAKDVTLGAFTLSTSLIDKITSTSPVQLSADTLPAELKNKLEISSNYYYLGDNPSSPQIGDTRISFEVVKPVKVSIISRQIGNTFEPYQTKAGDVIERLETGEFSADSMFKHAQEENYVWTWILRVVGFILMLIGLNLIFAPFAVFADVIPFIGSLIGGGIFLSSLFVSLILSSITISIAWIVYRPLIGILLIIAGCVTGFAVMMLIKKKNN